MQTSRDILYLLKHDFVDGEAPLYYCPECAQINGVLHYYPALRHCLDIRYVEFARPRLEIVSLIGEKNQGCPVLILAAPVPGSVRSLITGEFEGRSFVSGAKAIGEYFAKVFSVGRPH